MINLLPPESKSSLRYARRNLSLRSWIITLSLGLLGVGVLVGVGLLDLQKEVNSYRQQVAQAQATLNHDKLTETQKKVKDIVEQARKLNKQCIAEFVSDAGSMSFLFSTGIDYVQGNFLAPPMTMMTYEF